MQHCYLSHANHTVHAVHAAPSTPLKASSLRSAARTKLMIGTIPEDIKTNKAIFPFLVRSNELEELNSVVSYYCKLYVLEYILTHKLHTTSKDIEGFTVSLLDETELLKNDQDLSPVLSDKNMSLSVLFNFNLKVVNNCLTELHKYDGSNKITLIKNFRSSLNFLKLTDMFKDDADIIDVQKLANGKFQTFDEFLKFNADRTKLIKYNLSKLIKDEIKSNEEEDKALEQELEAMTLNDVESAPVESAPEPESAPEESAPAESAPVESAPAESDDGLELPETPKFIDEDVSLPGVPHFAPDDDNSDIKLPGAPTFLPDDDLSQINKDSSIHVFKPDEKPAPKPAPKPVAKPAQPVEQKRHAPLKKENITSIIDKQELISKIQKHCKFVISALNYEDLQTAEKELLQSLELLRQIKE